MGLTLLYYTVCFVDVLQLYATKVVIAKGGRKERLAANRPKALPPLRLSLYVNVFFVVRTFDWESHMQRKLVHKLGIAVVVVFVIGVSILSFKFIAQTQQNQRIPINGQTVPLLNQAQLLGAANEQQQLHLSVGLQLRNQQEL